MNDLREHHIVYLDDATPLLQEVISDLPAWQGRSQEEREKLIHLVHDYAVGEDWAEGDTWADVSFTKDEIHSFSQHILVEGDNGLPEWYSVPSDPGTDS